MAEQRTSHLGRFLLRVFLFLPACFAAWYWGGSVLTIPLHWLTSALMHAGFGDLVSAVGQTGTSLDFVTTLRPEHSTIQNSAGGVIEVDVGTLTYTFGLPLLAALILAADGSRSASKLIIGYLALLPFHVWSISADALKQMAITSGSGVSSQTGFAQWQLECIAYAYQFGTLILPAVVPIVVWVLLHRDFVLGLVAIRQRTGTGASTGNGS